MSALPTRRIRTRGCDGCGAADMPVEHMGTVGYVCAFCRRPESLRDLQRDVREAWGEPAREEQS